MRKQKQYSVYVYTVSSQESNTKSTNVHLSISLSEINITASHITSLTKSIMPLAY